MSPRRPLTSFAFVLVALATFSVSSEARRGRSKRPDPVPMVGVRDLRHVGPGGWPRETVTLYVDPVLGSFCRAEPPFLYQDQRVFVQLGNGGLFAVYLPRALGPRQGFSVWDPTDVSEVWLLYRAGRWELVGRQGSLYFSFAGGTKRRIQRPPGI